MLIISVAILYYTFMMEFSLYFEGATRSGAMFLFTAVSISSVCYTFRKRFPITKHLTSYILAIGANVLVYIIKYMGRPENMDFSSCCTTMADSCVRNSEFVLCSTLVLYNHRHKAPIYHIYQYPCHTHLGDNGTLFPLASGSRRI